MKEDEQLYRDKLECLMDTIDDTRLLLDKLSTKPDLHIKIEQLEILNAKAFMLNQLIVTYPNKKQ